MMPENGVRLLLEHAKELASRVEHIVRLELGLDAVNQRVELIVGQVDAQLLFDDGDRILLKGVHQLFVLGELVDDAARELDDFVHVHEVQSFQVRDIVSISIRRLKAESKREFMTDRVRILT